MQQTLGRWFSGCPKTKLKRGPCKLFLLKKHNSCYNEKPYPFTLFSKVKLLAHFDKVFHLLSLLTDF